MELAAVNPNIEIVERYINTNTKTLHRCKIDGYEWMIKPHHIINDKQGCPMCHNYRNTRIKTRNCRKTHEKYVDEVTIINPSIEVVGEYVNSATKILHRCKIDGNEWTARPNDILHGTGCPICRRNRKKTHEKYVAEVAAINPNIEVIGKYIGANIKILHRCKVDGCEWQAKPSNILCGKGCPACNISHGEDIIEKYLNYHKINYVPQYRFKGCKNKRTLPFDFYLPDYNMCIEYNGIQHYKSINFFGGKEALEYRQHNDVIKTKYCTDNNITLLCIRYDEDVEEVLNNFFKNHKKVGVV